MLYYFSGTGNSRLVCELLAEQLNDSCSTVINPLPCYGGKMGIVFPVYAWGMPNVVQFFLEKKLPQLIGSGVEYVYVVMTCGDDMGYTDALVKKALQRHGLSLDAAFSVQMPNTYVSLPGFDVDSKPLADSKEMAMRQQIPSIVKHIQARHRVTELCRGAYPHLKTYVLRPLFNWFLMSDRRFWTDTQRCTQCRKCVKQCPIANISLRDGKVLWSGNCTGCLACYHCCPSNAIQYGWFTKGKGQKK